jgi:hypothetical protein
MRLLAALTLLAGACSPTVAIAPDHPARPGARAAAPITVSSTLRHDAAPVAAPDAGQPHHHRHHGGGAAPDGGVR